MTADALVMSQSISLDGFCEPQSKHQINVWKYVLHSGIKMVAKLLMLVVIQHSKSSSFFMSDKMSSLECYTGCYWRQDHDRLMMMLFCFLLSGARLKLNLIHR